MRVTYNSLRNTISDNFQKNLSKLQELQDQLSSGKVINTPSDDPINTAKLSILKTKINQHEQFIKTIDESETWLTLTENAVNQINSNILEVRQVCVEGGNGALSDEGRNSLIIKLEQLKEELISNSNSKCMNKYIFAGLSTLEKPFNEGGGIVTYNGDAETMYRKITFGADIEININGDELFNMSGSAIPGDPNVFEIIDDLITSLQSGDIDNISNVILARIDRAHMNIVDSYSKIGSKISRLMMTRSQNENNMLSLDKMTSIIEDVDIAEKITELKKAEMTYQVSLSIAGRIFPSTLLDYLR